MRRGVDVSVFGFSHGRTKNADVLHQFLEQIQTKFQNCQHRQNTKNAGVLHQFLEQIQTKFQNCQNHQNTRNAVVLHQFLEQIQTKFQISKKSQNLRILEEFEPKFRKKSRFVNSQKDLWTIGSQSLSEN